MEGFFPLPANTAAQWGVPVVLEPERHPDNVLMGAAGSGTGLQSSASEFQVADLRGVWGLLISQNRRRGSCRKGPILSTSRSLKGKFSHKTEFTRFLLTLVSRVRETFGVSSVFLELQQCIFIFAFCMNYPLNHLRNQKNELF